MKGRPEVFAPEFNQIAGMPELFTDLTIKLHFVRLCSHGREWNYPQRQQAANTLYFVLGGDAFIRHGTNTMPLLPGHAYLLPRGCPLDLHCHTHIQKIWCWFDLLLHNTVDILDGQTTPFHLGQHDFTLAELPDMTARLFRRQIEDHLFWLGTICRYLARLDQDLSECYHHTRQRTGKLMPLFDYIENNLSAKLTLDELASVMKCHPNSLSRLFCRTTGMTLSRYLRRRLMQKAAAMLADRELAVFEIAHELGFADEYYFNRVFRKYFGIAPGKYRHGFFHDSAGPESSDQQS